MEIISLMERRKIKIFKEMLKIWATKIEKAMAIGDHVMTFYVIQVTL